MAHTPDRTALRLLDATMLVMRSLSAEIRQRNPGILPMHVGMLAKIDAGDFNMSELAEHLAVRLPTVSKSISVLVDRGWVERRTAERNRRQTLIRLTPAGRRAFNVMKRRAETHVAGLLAPLKQSERRQVDAALDCLCRTLSSHSRPGADA